MSPLRFAANLSMLYPEFPFLERFAESARDGFRGVECLFPYSYPAELLGHQLQENGLEQVLFNAPPGDWEAGERGIACLPGREAEFRSSFLQALQYARALCCRRIHVMSGIRENGTERERALGTYRDNLIWALGESEGEIDLMIEPINTRDMPGYLINLQEEAHELVREIGSKRVRVQMDLYHCQIMEGDVTSRLRRYLTGEEGRVGHLQIAGVPSRNEPSDSELSFEYLFPVLEQLEYSGWIGCEYRPRRGTREGLEWLRRYLRP